MDTEQKENIQPMDTNESTEGTIETETAETIDTNPVNGNDSTV